MRTPPERHVLPHVAPVVPKLVWILELLRIAIARTRKQHEDRTRRNLYSPNARRRARQPEVTLDGTLRPQRLFEERRDLRPVVTQRLLDVGALRHHPHARTEEFRRRLHACREQERRKLDDLL